MGTLHGTAFRTAVYCSFGNVIDRGPEPINLLNYIRENVNNNPFYMVGRDLHDMPYSYKKLLDSFLIVGHVPTIELNDSGSNCFYRTKHYMVIDAGASCVKRGGTLGCYCVDTDEEIYI